MQSAIERLAGVVSRRRRLILAVWVLLYLAAAPFAIQQQDRLTGGGFELDGTESNYVAEHSSDFPASAQEQEVVLLVRRDGGTDRDLAAAVRRVRRAAPDVENVRLGEPPSGRRPRVENGAIVPLVVDGDWGDRIDAASDLRKELDVGEGAKDGVETYLLGQDAMWAAIQEVQQDDLVAAERIALPITMIILLATFGALAAASLPLILGAITVTLTGALIYFISQQIEVSLFVPSTASMIGIGVAVDYSLFVLARYRQEIAAGASEEEARSRALKTSGLAVTFSGITVMVCLLGILFVEMQGFVTMAMAMIIVVAVSVLGAITLLPALIAAFGKRVYQPGRIAAIRGRVARFLSFGRRRDDDREFWARWTDRVMRRPVLSVVLASALMLALALPAPSMELDVRPSTQFPEGNEQREGTEIATRALGPGRLVPIQVNARFRSGGARSERNREAVARFRRSVARRPDVAGVDPAQPSRDSRSVLVNVLPRPADEAKTRDIVRDLRSASNLSRRRLERVADVNVGGARALTHDETNKIEDTLWMMVAFVVVLSFLIFMVMLRSIVLPLKAVFMTLLSVVAAWGVVVAIFQWGWLEPLGVDKQGYIEGVTVPLLLTVVFGLSMDYAVFMLTRIREFRGESADDREAVARGMRATAAAITSAALIMVSVFAGFGATGVPGIAHVGTGLAVAIALDATVVRLVLVPSTMALLGRWNWWFPRSLDRRLPRLAFDSVATTDALATSHPPVPSTGSPR